MEIVSVLPFWEEQNNGMLIPYEVFMEIGMNFETNFVLLSSLFLELLPFEYNSYLSIERGDSRSSLG